MKKFLLTLALVSTLGLATPKPAQAGLAIGFLSFDGCNECALVGIGIIVGSIPVGITVGRMSGPLLGVLAGLGTFVLASPTESAPLAMQLEKTFPKLGSRDVRDELARTLLASAKEGGQSASMNVSFLDKRDGKQKSQTVSSRIVRLDAARARQILGRDGALDDDTLDLYVKQLAE